MKARTAVNPNFIKGLFMYRLSGNEKVFFTDGDFFLIERWLASGRILFSMQGSSVCKKKRDCLCLLRG